MDKTNYKIAAASSDGIVVNSHFGRAKDFYIYTIDSKEQIKFLEKRTMEPVCNGGNHDDQKLNENLKNISDCSYLLVSRIGEGAYRRAEQFGIESYEIPGMIEDSIKQLINYIKIKNLF